MKLIRIAGLIGALCLGLMLGVMLGGETHGSAVVLIALGGALMAAICGLAEWL